MTLFFVTLILVKLTLIPPTEETPMAFRIEDDVFDPSMSDEGVWVDFFNGSKLKIGSTENKKYKSALAKMAKSHKLQLDSSNEDSFELVNRITCECLAKHVLLDWTGVSMEGVENIAYSVATGVKALTLSSKLRDFVVEQAGTPSNFQKEVVEQVKNT